MANLTSDQLKILAATKEVSANLNLYQGFDQPQIGITPLFYSRVWYPADEIANEEIKFEGNGIVCLNGYLPFSFYGALPAPFSGTFAKNSYLTFKPRLDNAFDIVTGVLEREILPIHGRMRFKSPFERIWLNWRGTWQSISQSQFSFAQNRLTTSPIWLMLSKEVDIFSDVPQFEKIFRYGISSTIPATTGSATITLYTGQQPRQARVYITSSGNIVNPLQVSVKQGNFATHTSTMFHTDFIWNATTGLGSPEYFTQNLDDVGGDLIQYSVTGGGATDSAILHIRLELEAK